MSTLKAQFDETRALHLLAGLYPDAHSLERLSGGEASQAYAFVSESRPLVLRVNHHASYATDVRLSELFRTSPVPVPAILQAGRHEGHYWAISERARGTLVEDLDLTRHRVLRPSLVATMIAIHDTPIPGVAGYGWLGESGHASHPGWRAFLETGGTYGEFVDWDRALGRATARQRSLVETAWEAAHRLFDRCPEDRVLNHGDYTYDNLLTDGRRVTGVIDWNNCLLGDPLWDVAWTDIWTPGLEFAPAYLRARPTVDAADRILCYQLLFAASAIGFAIHTEQPTVSPWVEDQLATRVQAAQALH